MFVGAGGLGPGQFRDLRVQAHGLRHHLGGRLAVFACRVPHSFAHFANEWVVAAPRSSGRHNPSQHGEFIIFHHNQPVSAVTDAQLARCENDP